MLTYKPLRSWRPHKFVDTFNLTIKTIIMTIKTNFILAFLLLITAMMQGQNTGYYYYYQGKKVNLTVNPKMISLAIEGEKPTYYFTSNGTNSALLLSDVEEDYSRAIVKPFTQAAIDRRYIRTFYVEMESESNGVLQQYFDEIEGYNKAQTIFASPSFLMNGKELGLSTSFYVKLKSQNDIGLLANMANSNNVEILGQDLSLIHI